MEIQEIMTRPAVTCRATDTLNATARLMWDHDCGAIPITDDAGTLVGMVTDRDICMSAYTKGKPLDAISVSDAMSKPAFSCGPDDLLEEAERLMSERRIRRVPIVDDDGRPVGVLSLNDIARHTATAPKKHGLDRKLTQTMAAICQPRSATM